MQSKAKTMWGAHSLDLLRHDNGSTHVFVPHHKFVPRSEYMIDTCFENNIAKKWICSCLKQVSTTSTNTAASHHCPSQVCPNLNWAKIQLENHLEYSRVFVSEVSFLLTFHTTIVCDGQLDSSKTYDMNDNSLRTSF